MRLMAAEELGKYTRKNKGSLMCKAKPSAKSALNIMQKDKPSRLLSFSAGGDQVSLKEGPHVAALFKGDSLPTGQQGKRKNDYDSALYRDCPMQGAVWW